MESTVSTETSFLGKRSRQPGQNVEQLQTPGPTPNPKRVKQTTTPVLDGDGNKENVPPLNVTPVNSANTSPMSSRAARALRRSTTSESFVTPPARTAIKRNSSFSTSFANLKLATPPATPLTLLPLHARVRALLRATCDDHSSMPARDSERDTITRFINTSFGHSKTDAFHCLYISGSPGCGKTALMNSILNSLNLDGTRIVNINCMALANVNALWDRLVEEFDGVLHKKRKSMMRKGNGRETIESLLSEMTTRCIIVLDEMDHIASNPQSISSLLKLARSDKLCVIGIANTHTLTLSPSSSLDDIRTLHFSPYTSAQLLQILQSRLSTLTTPGQTSTDSATDANMKGFLPLPTLTLLTKKIAGLTGDVRTLFEALRGAIDLAVISPVITKVDDDENFFAKSGPVCSVTPAHVLSALKTVTQSQLEGSRHTSAQSPLKTPGPTTSNIDIISKVACLGLQARLVLLSVLVAVKRIEAGLTIDPPSSHTSSSVLQRSTCDKNVVMDGPHLHAYYSHILRRGGEASISTPVSRTEFSDLLGMLEGIGLVALGPFQESPRKKRVCVGRSASFGKAGDASVRHSSTEVRLASGIWVDEVLRGLGVTCSRNAQDVKEEEMNAIWLKEDAVIRKELKAIDNKRKAHGGNQMFVDASLDD